MTDLRKYGKRTVVLAGVAFIAFHVLVFGFGALGVAHVAGFDVPFLDHSHGDCDCPALPDDKQKKES